MPTLEQIRKEIDAVREEFGEKDLLVYASGIAMRFLIATIPVALFTLAVLGTVGLEEVWENDIAPGLRENVSGSVYTVIDDAVGRVLGRQNGYWITVGAAVAAFSLAGISSAVTRTLNRVHGFEDDRPWRERALNHLFVGVSSALLLLAAIAAVRLGPYAFDALFGDSILVGVVSFVLRWVIAIALLVLVLVLLKRVAPDAERPLRRLAVGSAITVGAWVLMSVLFGVYLRYIASYDSIFGNLATAYIAVQYVALSALAYVSGIVLDARAIRLQPG